LYLRAAAIPLDTVRNKQAIAMLEKSVGLDANFAPAWLMFGRKYNVAARYVSGKTAMMERANAASRCGVSLDTQYVPAAAGMIGGYIEGGNLPKASGEIIRLRIVGCLNLRGDGGNFLRRTPLSAGWQHVKTWVH
jgi:hypothetical protein